MPGGGKEKKGIHRQNNAKSSSEKESSPVEQLAKSKGSGLHSLQGLGWKWSLKPPKVTYKFLSAPLIPKMKNRSKNVRRNREVRSRVATDSGAADLETSRKIVGMAGFPISDLVSSRHSWRLGAVGGQLNNRFRSNEK